MTTSQSIINQLKSAPKDKPYSVTITKDTPSMELVAIENGAEAIGWKLYTFHKELATFHYSGISLK